MFQRLIRCPIAFFDLNPIGMTYFMNSVLFISFILVVGRILNRFTKDIALIDEQLPNTLFDFLHVCFEHTRLILYKMKVSSVFL